MYTHTDTYATTTGINNATTNADRDPHTKRENLAEYIYRLQIAAAVMARLVTGTLPKPQTTMCL
jgi:hypothetical protein